MKARNLVFLLLLGVTAAPAVQAQIQHVQLRVEGMT